MLASATAMTLKLDSEQLNQQGFAQKSSLV
jgi:hypothetical protein